MGKITCVEFQREPLKSPTKYLNTTLKDTILYAVEDLKLSDLRAHMYFWNVPFKALYSLRDHFVYAPRQWEMTVTLSLIGWADTQNDPYSLHMRYTQITEVHGANMGPTWALSAPDGPHFGPKKLAVRDMFVPSLWDDFFKLHYVSVMDWYEMKTFWYLFSQNESVQVCFHGFLPLLLH